MMPMFQSQKYIPVFLKNRGQVFKTERVYVFHKVSLFLNLIDDGNQKSATHLCCFHFCRGEVTENHLVRQPFIF